MTTMKICEDDDDDLNMRTMRICEDDDDDSDDDVRMTTMMVIK